MPNGGSFFATEVGFRINQRLTATQIVPYLNRALSLIEGAGSYVWDLKQTTLTPSASTGTVDLPADADVGKKIVVNDATGSPIERVTADKFNAYNSSGFQGISSSQYNVWILGQPLVGTNPGSLRLSPILNPAAALSVIYHQLPPVLTTGSTPTVLWFQTWIDDLLIDFAEMEIKRILNFAGWPDLQTRCQAKLVEVKSIFSSERENTGPVSEVQAAEVEKTNLGRN